MPDDNAPQAILDLVQGMRGIEQRAAQYYQPVVDDILRTGSRDVQYIERTLDGLLDFCGDEPGVMMYRQLCRHSLLAVGPSGNDRLHQRVPRTVGQR